MFAPPTTAAASRRVTAHDVRADEFGAFALFLGAGVPVDEEDAHQREGDDPVELCLVDEHEAQVGVLEPITGAGEGDQGGVVAEQRDIALDRGLVGVDARKAARRSQSHPGDRDDPHGQPHPIPSQDEADQSPDPREGRHRSIDCVNALSSRPSPVPSPPSLPSSSP
jgi:hypothetical protein